jgi:hypothetical protein
MQVKRLFVRVTLKRPFEGGRYGFVSQQVTIAGVAEGPGNRVAENDTPFAIANNDALAGLVQCF